jgi:hypothetical protein
VIPTFVRLAAIVVAAGTAAATLVHPAIGIGLGLIAIVYAVLVLRPEEPRATSTAGPRVEVSVADEISKHNADDLP